LPAPSSWAGCVSSPPPPFPACRLRQTEEYETADGLLVIEVSLDLADDCGDAMGMETRYTVAAAAMLAGE
jgi:hypothetical protein